MAEDGPAPRRRMPGRPRGRGSPADGTIVRSLDRAMQVLEHLSRLPGATLTELAADLGQSPATIYRILVTLAGRDLVERDGDAQLWRIGPRTYEIGARYLHHSDLVGRARPILRQLADGTGETATLGLARGTGILVVAQHEAAATIRAVIPPGTLLPVHASGIGKALLAQMSDDRLSRLFATAPLDRVTRRTLTEPAALRADLEATRERGYAVDHEEMDEGMGTLAVPIFGPGGTVVAGLAVSGPVARIGGEANAALAVSLRRAGRDLSRAVGAGAGQGAGQGGGDRGDGARDGAAGGAA